MIIAQKNNLSIQVEIIFTTCPDMLADSMGAFGITCLKKYAASIPVIRNTSQLAHKQISWTIKKARKSSSRA
jgi:hypothetical protein